MRKRLFFLCIALITCATPAAVTARAPLALKTLCILDFNRLGDDASVDWLKQGLADMMISTMNRLSPYQVIERTHLRHILQEHALVTSGLVDIDTAITQAQLAKAHLLLLGSFARQQDDVTIQMRLMRVTDQQILAQVTWQDQLAHVLSAPQTLSENLLDRLQEPVDPTQLQGIETEIPTTIDVAKAYYSGTEAFDRGQYVTALAHYLDGVKQAGAFIKLYPAVLKMYDLLDQSEHGVVFARQLAESFEANHDIQSALEYYFAAAERCLDPLKRYRVGITLLEKLLHVVEQHEQKTSEIVQTKQFILDRIDVLHNTGKYRTFGKILQDRSIRYRMWARHIGTELTRRAEEQARGGYTIFTGNKWVKQPVPKPSVLMWKIRAHQTLARAYAHEERIEDALDSYQALLAEYDFLTQHPLSAGIYHAPIKTEAHFMVLHHYAKTGQLIRDHAFNTINRLNIVTDGSAFRRDFSDESPDARARVMSRYPDRGHEYFDFAAPEGYQIDAVTLEAKVAGIAHFAVSLPHPTGWPPQFSFSKRLVQFKFSRKGSYTKTVALPAGTEFFSIGTSWGPGLYANSPTEVLHYQLFGPDDGKDIIGWQASFAVSAKERTTPTTDPVAQTRLESEQQPLVARYTAGWDSTFVVRPSFTAHYASSPPLDVYAEDWLVYAMEGDIQIFHRTNPSLTIRLPRTINTKEKEFDPSLVRTRDGQYALLWARGSSKRHAQRFVALSKNFLQWETPRRLIFEQPAENIGYTYGQVEPLERTHNVVPTPDGYMMLLAQGFARYSDDLWRWRAPQKILAHNQDRNRLIRTRDGTIWAVYENASDERQPYTSQDFLSGYYVMDGKRYRHVSELHLSRSVDGRHWQPSGKVVLPGQASGLWAFPVSTRQLSVAMTFNNLFVKWFTVSHSRALRQIDAKLQFMHQSDGAECFVDGTSLTCIRPVFDFNTQHQMLLGTRSRTLYQKLIDS